MNKILPSKHHAGHLHQELRPRRASDHPADAVSQQGLPDEHPQLEPQQRGRRDLPGGAQARVHRPVLPRPRLHHPDGQPVRYEVGGDVQRHGRLAQGLPPGLNTSIKAYPKN